MVSPRISLHDRVHEIIRCLVRTLTYRDNDPSIPPILRNAPQFPPQIHGPRINF